MITRISDVICPKGSVIFDHPYNAEYESPVARARGCGGHGQMLQFGALYVAEQTSAWWHERALRRTRELEDDL